MKVARIAVLAVALGAAGAAAMLTNSILPNGQLAEAPGIGPDMSTQQVLVAARDLNLGNRVKAGDVRWQTWPSDALAEQFITDVKKPDAMQETVGMIARAPVTQGEPISFAKLVRSDQGGFMSAILDSGMRAISIRISPETGAGGFILPNDRVDVILTNEQAQSGGEGGAKYSSEMILTNVRVLAIDQTVAEEDGRQVVVGKTATLELAPQQAELLALGERRGVVSLALRSLADSGEGNDDKQYRGSGSVKVVKFGVATQVTTSR
ncbi:Flp pilus assembly protein CpaB [Devosia sp.]|uniref:Flp pilus assembly protein CpaB n=1 Tax=Devosia sp. TaxID=1871048 RepID=UPI002734D42E|nr:Flp pilus assembly protein CpaB [Devosia sp.]MDP2781510.1 Flp pilus assembly protein CpaB [Devosia sp.]